MRTPAVLGLLALLTLPAATARGFSKTLFSMMAFSVCLGLVFSLGGLWLSSLLDIPSGATIILLATAGYVISLPFSRIGSG